MARGVPGAIESTARLVGFRRREHQFTPQPRDGLDAVVEPAPAPYVSGFADYRAAAANARERHEWHGRQHTEREHRRGAASNGSAGADADVAHVRKCGDGRSHTERDVRCQGGSGGCGAPLPSGE